MNEPIPTAPEELEPFQNETDTAVRVDPRQAYYIIGVLKLLMNIVGRQSEIGLILEAAEQKVTQLVKEATFREDSKAA